MAPRERTVPILNSTSSSARLLWASYVSGALDQSLDSVSTVLHRISSEVHLVPCARSRYAIDLLTPLWTLMVSVRAMGGCNSPRYCHRGCTGRYGYRDRGASANGSLHEVPGCPGISVQAPVSTDNSPRGLPLTRIQPCGSSISAPALREAIHEQCGCWHRARADHGHSANLPMLEHHVRYNSEPQSLCTILWQRIRHRSRHGKVHSSIRLQGIIRQAVRDGLSKEHGRQHWFSERPVIQRH